MQRILLDNTQHWQQTDIHAAAGSDLAIPATERKQTHSLDRSANGVGEGCTDPTECLEDFIITIIFIIIIAIIIIIIIIINIIWLILGKLSAL